MNVWPLLLALVLLGCSDEPRPPRVSKEDRLHFSEQAKSLPPDTRSYPVGGNQLLVIDVPVGGTAKRIDSQKCFVWRDQEFRTASIQCPADSPGDLVIGGPTADSPSP